MVEADINHVYIYKIVDYSLRYLIEKITVPEYALIL